MTRSQCSHCPAIDTLFQHGTRAVCGSCWAELERRQEDNIELLQRRVDKKKAAMVSDAGVQSFIFTKWILARIKGDLVPLKKRRRGEA